MVARMLWRHSQGTSLGGHRQIITVSLGIGIQFVCQKRKGHMEKQDSEIRQLMKKLTGFRHVKVNGHLVWKVGACERRWLSDKNFGMQTKLEKSMNWNQAYTRP